MAKQDQAENGNSDPGTESDNKVASTPVKPTSAPIGYEKKTYTGIATDSGS